MNDIRVVLVIDGRAVLEVAGIEIAILTQERLDLASSAFVAAIEAITEPNVTPMKAKRRKGSHSSE